MPLHLPGSIQIGPHASGSTPTDIPSLLASFGVTWYGGFRKGLLLFTSATDQLTPATLGMSVGQWAPSWTAGGFSAKWVQTTSSKRPSYESVYGSNGIRGDGTSVWLQLDSSTALNRAYTVLIAAAVPGTVASTIYSHNVSRMRFSSPSGTTGTPSIYADNVTGVTINSVLSTTPIDASNAGYRAGWRSAGSSFYNNVPNLLRLSSGSGYSDASITETWLIDGLLTNSQIAQCLPLLAL